MKQKSHTTKTKIQQHLNCSLSATKKAAVCIFEAFLILNCVFGNMIIEFSGHNLKQNCFWFASFSCFEITQIVGRKKKNDMCKFLESCF